MTRRYKKFNTSSYDDHNNGVTPFPDGTLVLDQYGVISLHDGVNSTGAQVFPQLGNITLPQGSTINEVTFGISGGTTTGIVLTPGGEHYASQQLIIYPTNGVPEGNHLHLTSGDQTQTDLYLGNDDQYVKVAANSNVVIGTNGDSHHWTFDSTGRLFVPNNSSQSITSIGQGPDSDWVNPNQHVWSIRQYSDAAAFANDGGAPTIWFNYAYLPGDWSQLRGAIIEFHAIVSAGSSKTVVGSITLSRNYYSDFSVTHSMAGGSIGYSFWEAYNDGEGTLGLVFKNYDGSPTTVMIQWTSRLFFGSEWDC